MAGKQIKQEIVLSGEKQYNAAIRDAQRNLKTLKSELKAETAELGRNATEQQKNETRAKSLKKQIQEQEKIVKTLREALEKARAEYGDNEAVVAKWEQKLNEARATLANMNSDLEGVGEGMGKVKTNAAAATVATKSVADALGSIGDAGENVSDAIEGIFSGMIDTITSAVGELWDLIAQTAAKANEWGDIAGYWGTDAQTIQQYANSVKSVGKNFDDLQSAVSRIVMGGKGETIAELLGISDVNYSSDWDYAMAVMDQMSRMRAQGQDMTPIYEQIFGEKKGTKVSDLVSGWKDIQEMLPTFNGNTSGYGMSDEELETMDSLAVQIAEIETKWESLKDNIAAGFGKTVLDLMVNVEGTLDGIADYLNAKDDSEKQAALKKIRTNVEEFFTKLGDIIRDCIGILRGVGEELQGSEDPLTSAIGDILVKLAESLQWMVDNADKVKDAFTTIFGLWLLAKLGAVAGKLGGILMQIEAIKTFKGISVASGAASSAGTAAGSSWGAAFGSAVMKAVPWLAGLLVFAENAITPQGNDDFYDENGNVTEIGRELGLPETRQEAEAKGGASAILYGTEEEQREANKNSLLGKGGIADRVGEAGKVTSEQYIRLNNLWQNYSGQYHTNESQKDLLDSAREAFAGNEDEFEGWVKKIYELSQGDNLPKYLPEEWFGVRKQEEESIDLDPTYTEAQKSEAIQDWWDAWRNASGGGDSWDEEESAFAWMEEVLGDGFGEVWDKIMEKLDATPDQGRLEDLPLEWYAALVSGGNGGTVSGSGDSNGVTSEDLRNFNGLPAGILQAVKEGARSGVSGLRVDIDGQSAGRILAPYVSQEIAEEIVR